MLVWLPSAIYLMATGHLWKGLILVVWCSAVVGTVDNIIRPLVVGSRVELHPLLLLFSLLGGLHVFGFIGFLHRAGGHFRDRCLDQHAPARMGSGADFSTGRGN